MARPRKFTEEKDFSLKLVKYACQTGAPKWYIEQTYVDSLSVQANQYLDNNECKDMSKVRDFLCKIFPEVNKVVKSFNRNETYKNIGKDIYRSKKETRIKRAVCNSMTSYFCKNNIKLECKSGKFLVALLGYGVLDLCDHLENLFDDKMSWDNYGDYWQIDHIYPISKLKFKTVHDDNFKKCWSLDNLRPLNKKENLLKSDKVSKG